MPAKISPQLQARLEEAFAVNSTVSVACAYAGIHESTFYAWIERGQRAIDAMEAAAVEAGTAIDEVPMPDGEGPYVLFARSITQTRAEATMALQTLAHQHAKLDGKLALEILARRDPQNWGRTNRLELQGKDGEVPRINFYIPEERPPTSKG